jgi:hypothetical protein
VIIGRYAGHINAGAKEKTLERAGHNQNLGHTFRSPIVFSVNIPPARQIGNKKRAK